MFFFLGGGGVDTADNLLVNLLAPTPQFWECNSSKLHLRAEIVEIDAHSLQLPVLV